MFGSSCLRAEDLKNGDEAATFKTHPKVFSMIGCWLSDSATPVVTEINLDAVEENDNQFNFESLKEENGWITWYKSDEENKNFMCYRVVEAKNNHYKVEYKQNDGGTMTSLAVIEFSVVDREILEKDTPTKIRVLRVNSYILE